MENRLKRSESVGKLTAPLELVERKAEFDPLLRSQNDAPGRARRTRLSLEPDCEVEGADRVESPPLQGRDKPQRLLLAEAGFGSIYFKHDIWHRLKGSGRAGLDRGDS